MKKIKIGFICLVIAFTISLNVYAIFIGNEGDCGYKPGCMKGYITYSQENQFLIRSYIQTSASYFFESYENMLHLLNILESSDSYNTQNFRIIDDIISNMANAVNSYSDLIKITTITPYDETFVSRLKEFNYQNFMNKFPLLPDVFCKVELALKEGNINKIWETLFSNNKEILNKLYIVKSAIDSQSYPPIDVLYQISQLYMETQLYGQYATQIFKLIK